MHKTNRLLTLIYTHVQTPTESESVPFARYTTCFLLSLRYPFGEGSPRALWVQDLRQRGMERRLWLSPLFLMRCLLCSWTLLLCLSISTPNGEPIKCNILKLCKWAISRQMSIGICIKLLRIGVSFLEIFSSKYQKFRIWRDLKHPSGRGPIIYEF